MAFHVSQLDCLASAPPALRARVERRWTTNLDELRQHPPADLIHAYHRLACRLYDEVDMRVSEQLVSEPPQFSAMLLRDSPWSYEAFRKALRLPGTPDDGAETEY